MPKRRSVPPLPPPVHTDYPLLTMLEAAAQLNVSLRTMQRWKQYKMGPQVLLLPGNRRMIRYRQEDIDAFLGKSVPETKPSNIRRLPEKPTAAE